MLTSSLSGVLFLPRNDIEVSADAPRISGKYITPAKARIAALVEIASARNISSMKATVVGPALSAINRQSDWLYVDLAGGIS